MGIILKWDNLLMSLSTDSVSNRRHEEWPLLSAIRQPKSAASSKNTRAEESFFFLLKHLFCSFVDLALWHIGFTHQDIFCFKIKQIITIQYFSPITKTNPFKRVGLYLALDSLVKNANPAFNITSSPHQFTTVFYSVPWALCTLQLCDHVVKLTNASRKRLSNHRLTRQDVRCDFDNRMLNKWENRNMLHIGQISSGLTVAC